MSLSDRLASISTRDEPSSLLGRRDKDVDSSDGSGGNLMQKCVIIQRDEKGYGFTVSGDNPVFVASVKQDGAAAKAGVQNGDRIVKVNGTLVTQRNHLDVVKLIKSGSYVALTLLGKPSSSGSSGGTATHPSGLSYIRDSVIGRVTAPQPVDPDKDREMWQQKVRVTRAMYETAKEDFEKLQKLYVSKPSEKLHGQLLEKERTVKILDNQLKQLTGGEEPVMASQLPTATSDLGSMSDSSQTSPSLSPTPDDPHSRHNGQNIEFLTSQPEIIHPEYEEDNSDEDQVNDPGPFAEMKLLENKPAHMAVLLNYLISNSDPSAVLFHIISDLYSRSPGSNKELRKWAYEIFSTFVYNMAPLSISVEDNIISQIDSILTSSGTRTDNENVLRTMFHAPRQSVQTEITELLTDFRSKKDLGMGNLYGIQNIHDNMDRAAESKVAEELLMPHLKYFGAEDNSRGVMVDKDLATGWALATFLRSLGGAKSANSAILDRVQTFMMRDKKSIKFPGSRSSRAKAVKGHQLNLQHFYVTTFCTFCGNLIWGVGYQGYQCHNCEMTLHKSCAEEMTEVCGGKQKRRISARLPLSGVITNRRPNSNSTGVAPQLSYSATDQMSQPSPNPGRSPSQTEAVTQPYPKEEDSELAGLSGGHSVQNMVNRFQELVSPVGPAQGNIGGSAQQDVSETLAGHNTERRDSSSLNRTGSLNNKGKKSERPARRAKSDVDMGSDTFKDMNQSASSSASSLSNRSVDSPGSSIDNVNDLLRAQYDDPDMDLEPDLPPLKQVLPEDVLRKLKPKEKKRQEVINELFYTERAHLRNLKVLDLLFNRPMYQEKGIMAELARALFPNMEEMISLHVTFVRAIKERSVCTPVITDVGDLLLQRFGGEAGDIFCKGCTEYCRNQAFALDALKKQTRKEMKLQQFLHDAESNSLCRRLQLKDLVPSQMQRLTKYPLLIDSLLKYTQPQSEEYMRLERAHVKCKNILALVNQAVKECENYHKLKEIQKKLDRKSLDGFNDPTILELKSLDLTQHKLIFDSALIWKLRSHRTVDLHVLLFEDLLVLLQKQDDRYLLKCQNTNVQPTRDDKYTHFPVLKLQNLLARTLATEKRSFFVVNISESRAQMYEFTAASSELRLKWCKLINEKADELKTISNLPYLHSNDPSQVSQAAQAAGLSSIPPHNISDQFEQTSSSAQENIFEVTEQLSRRLNIGEDAQSEGGLILPEEVSVSDAVTSKSSTDSSPQELLHLNWLQLENALSEKGHILANMLNLSWNQCLAITTKPSDALVSRGREEEEGCYEDGDKAAECLVAKALEISCLLMSLVTGSVQVLGKEAAQHMRDTSNPSSPSRALSTLSPAVSYQQIQPPPQLLQQHSLSMPVSMDQLKDMASQMNAILSKLADVINTGSDEKQRLRLELHKAQLRLDALKQMKRQMTEADTSPSGRTSPYAALLYNIPLVPYTTDDTLTGTCFSEEATAADILLQEDASIASTLSLLAQQQEEEAEMLKEKYEMENMKQTWPLTGLLEQSTTSEHDYMHTGIQEATVTQLEEMVEHLSLCGDPQEMVPVVATETQANEAELDGASLIDMSEDYDSQEVSLTDLSLLDPVSIRVSTQQQHDADLDDSERKRRNSRTKHQERNSLSTTTEEDNSSGEERGQDGEDI
uniref:Uncharacterized protein n=1 Tax=Arion vulgaris TaxID=1028688 RepID=A0A0B7BJT2_9EUPU